MSEFSKEIQSNFGHFIYLFIYSLSSDFIYFWFQVVPVVMGGTDYTRDAPPHSVINVEYFKSPEHLAQYLKELDKNENAYNEYFNWKNKYKIVSVNESFREGFCKLCEVLKWW